MKAELLKIAGVKSEAEFYKKFPSEEAFMKKHGKAVKKLMAKRAQVGTMIPNIGTPEQNLTPISFDNDYMNDSVAKLTGGKTSQELRDDAMYQAKMADLNKPEKPGFMEQITNIAQGAFSGMNNSAKNGGKFEPHMMYDPKTKKGKKAKTLKEHLALKKKGWGHTAPKAQVGDNIFESGNFQQPNIGQAYSSPMAQFFNIQSGQSFGQNAQNVINSDGFKTGLSIVDDAISISDQIKSQKENLAQVKQNRKVAEIALQASKTMPEKIERKYVRPEDIQNTGEEFFPIYGVGTNVLSRNGGVYKAQQGGMFNGEYMPLTNPNQQKQFKGGGFVYGGGPAGQAGTQFAGIFGVNDDAGSNIGGKVGSTAGMAIGGPVGAFLGGALGSGVGDLLDRNDRRVRIEQDKLARINKEMAYGSIAPSIQAGYASHVKNGGKIELMRSGGHMRGNYIPPNPSALDTMKMGGELKTLWGGEADTVSYNPYAGGESIQFKGNSHDYRDPKTGQTGIGVAYGKDSVANNEAVVEVENEPAQQLRDGGGTENLVVYGDLKIPEEYVAEIGDDRAKGKKFKNYVSDVLNKDEAKINKKMEKAADSGLESDNTVFGQLERSTADAILKGSDMKLKNIAEKKNILADLQSALNETFDELAIKGNEFITKNKIVEDPERVMNNMAKSGIEINPENKGKFTAWAKERGMSVAEAANKVMANTDEYSPGVVKMANFAKNARKFKKGENGIDVPKLQESIAGNVSKDDFNKQIGGGDIPTTDKSPEELLEDNWVRDENDPNLFTRKKGDSIEAVQLSGNSLGYTPPGQSIDKETGLAGGIAMEQIAELENKNPWFGKFDLTKPKVKYDGKMVHPDVLRFQKEFNKRVEGTDIKKIQKIDGVLGQETFGAEFTPAVEGKKAEVEKVKVAETTSETTTAAPMQQRGIPAGIFPPRPVEGEALDVNQLLGEYAALASNTLEPVYAQTFQPRLRVPFDISLQAAKNDVISQSRALQRNPALQANPAALALAQAPTYAALNKLNETEFIANQKMKDDVYSSNLDQLNKARLINLGIYDKQQDRQAQAVANTKATTLAALNSISDKYARKKLENRMEQVYANMYPTYRYNRNFQTEVQQPASFNIPGYGTVSGIPSLATPGFAPPGTQQVMGGLNILGSVLGAQDQYNQSQGSQMRGSRINRALQNINPDEIYDYVNPNDQNIYNSNMLQPIETGVAKKGKTVKKNNKNSNILKALRGL
jgi:hypothetical protein